MFDDQRVPDSSYGVPLLGPRAADAQHPAIGWLPSAAIGLAVGAVLGLVLLLIPHLIIKVMPWGGREFRVLLATGFVLGSTAGLIALVARVSRAPRVPR